MAQRAKKNEQGDAGSPLIGLRTNANFWYSPTNLVPVPTDDGSAFDDGIAFDGSMYLIHDTIPTLKQQRHAEWLARITNNHGIYDQADNLPIKPFDLPILTPKLIGLENWDLWQDRVKRELQGKSLDGLLGINFERPPCDGSKKSMKWFFASRFVGMWLLENVSDEQRKLVTKEADRSNYVDEIWDTLEEHCRKARVYAKWKEANVFHLS